MTGWLIVGCCLGPALGFVACCLVRRPTIPQPTPFDQAADQAITVANSGQRFTPQQIAELAALGDQGPRLRAILAHPAGGRSIPAEWVNNAGSAN